MIACEGDPDTGRNAACLSGERYRSLEAADDPLPQGETRRGIPQVRRQDGEFVAAHPHHRVPGPDLGQQSPRDRLQHGVAGGMAQGVVDILEIVEVHQDNPEVGPRRLQAFGHLFQGAPVLQSGQGVGERLFLGRDLGAFQADVQPAAFLERGGLRLDQIQHLDGQVGHGKVIGRQAIPGDGIHHRNPERQVHDGRAVGHRGDQPAHCGVVAIGQRQAQRHRRGVAQGREAEGIARATQREGPKERLPLQPVRGGKLGQRRPAAQDIAVPVDQDMKRHQPVEDLRGS